MRYNMSYDILKIIAVKLLELFVVNRNAYAIQKKDSRYYTVYNRLTENDIYMMLKKRTSIGTYQQLFKNPYLKWICFDFDCKDKDDPDILGLYKDCTMILCKYLEENGISYINEFSGRRGIHTWILLDDYIRKDTAYDLLNAIKIRSGINFDTDKYGLDEFPKTAASKGNKLGLMVKLPLSVHQNGEQSFFFEGVYNENKKSPDFFEKQLEMLDSFKPNNTNAILNKFGITKENNTSDKAYQKFYAVGEDSWTLSEIKEILSNVEVYKNIFKRFEYGEPFTKDRYVMLGTLGKIPNGINILMELFRYTSDFSEEITREKISESYNKYYPATFRYLYHLYNIDMEEGLDPDQTALQYLKEKSDKNIEIFNVKENERELICNSSLTLKKESAYLFSNDEVPVVSVFLDLKNMTNFDTNKINEKLNSIKRGDKVSAEPEPFYIFERIESENKTRKMITLGAHDRVLTSHLALNLFYDLNKNIKSFSYNPNYLSKSDMFFHWYNSWGKYLSAISKYILTGMYDDYNVMTLDIRHFYDSIDFMSVYKTMKEHLSCEEENILSWLICYNEALMKKINGETRIGVPQGPAYARIIAEIFLGIIIERILGALEGNENEIKVYRYVDDIIIFYDDSFDGRDLFKKIKDAFLESGLYVNEEKSCIYGKISKLSDKQKAKVLREGQFQYGLKKNDYSYLLETEYVKLKVNEVIDSKGGFKLSDISYYFSIYTNDNAKYFCFLQYADLIVKSSIGRGSGFSYFYQYIFDNSDVLQIFTNKKLYNLIPINTLNFSCFLSSLYYAVVKDVENKKFQPIIADYVVRLCDNLQDIESIEDRGLLLSLRDKEEYSK